jgi:uncharacterized protein YjdB
LCCLLLVGTAACSGGDSTGTPAGSGGVATIEVLQPELTVGLGSTVALQVVVRDGAGRALTNRTVTWTSSDPTTATVSALGVVSALRVGSVQIAATVEGRSAVTNVTIAPKSVASVQVQPSELRLLAGASFQLSARTLDDAGVPLEGRPVIWASTDRRIAVVDTTGHVTAIAPGVATLTATSESRSVSVGVVVSLVPVARVDVTPVADTIVVGQSTQLSVVLRDSVGGALVDRAVSWGTSSVDVATVSSAGLVSGVSPGVAIITAASAGRTFDVRIVVRPRPVGSVIVSPGQAALIVGQTVRLTVQVTDDNGTLLPDRSVSYRSANPGIATVAADGAVTGTGVGATEIVVTSEGRVGRVNVAVAPIPVASVAVDPATVTLTVGESTRVIASPLDGSGSALAGRTIVWTSSAPAVATVSADGTVQAVGAGTAVLLVSVEGRTATVTVAVRAVPVGRVTVTPATATVIIGDALDLSAEVRNADGALLTDRVVLWTSSDERVAVVSSTGRVRALTTGAAQIRASADGVSGASAITVIVEPVLTVTTEPQSLALTLPSGTGQLVATARGRNGIALPNRAITYSSSDPGIATVSSTGRVTPVSPGNTTVVAASEGREVIVPVTVLRAPVSTVSASLAATAVAAGTTTTASALVKDEAGNTLSGRTVEWSSSNTAVATVSSSGVVSALSAGTATITATSEGKAGTVSLTVTPASIATISVTLGAVTLTEGATTQATAVLRDAGGATLLGRAVSWSSTNAAVATVSPSGVVTALQAGATTIIATIENKSSGANLTVTPRPVATVSVSLGAASLQEGATTQASAVLRDAGNAVLTGRDVVWSTSAAGTATVSSTGVVTAVRAGTATITATSEGKIGSATLTITAAPPAPVGTVTATVADASLVAGETTQASAVLKDAAGNTLTGRTVTWASSNTAVATVSSTGLVSALNAGTASITASSEGRSGSVTVTVAAPPPIPVAAVTVTLASASVQAGGATTATAVTRSAAGAVLTGRVVTWASSNTAVATVSPAGAVSAIAAGSATITATSEGRTGSATFTVTAPPPAPVNTVTASLVDASLVEGEATQASAVLKDAAGNTLTGRTVTWASSNTTVATVSSAGLVSALRAGTASITATSEGRSGSVTVTVTAPPPTPVAAVTVTLANSSVQAGGSTTATAVTRSAAGAVLTGRVVTWTSSNTAVATVSSTGAVSALSAGTATITATSEGRTGSATFTVTAPPPAPVSTVTTTLAASSVTEGATTQATAVLRAANGNTLTGRVVTWSSSNTTIATVSSAGVVSALKAGTSTITATSEGKSDGAVLTVVVPPVATVTLSPTSATVMEGTTGQATAVLRDANGNVLTGRVVTWSSSNTAVATVSSTGVMSALSPGTATITATSEGRSGSGTLTVGATPVATVTVALGSSSINEGVTTTATATMRNGNGIVLNGRSVAWSSSNTTVATVSSTGVVTALRAGTTSITGTSEGKSGSATLTVTQVSVGQVTVTLASSSVDEGEGTTASAVVRSTSGAVINGATVTWATSDNSVATVTSTGAVSTVRAGTVTITGTSGGRSGSATLTVRALTVARLDVTPAFATVQSNGPLSGRTVQLTATVFAANNRVLTGRAVAWSSSHPDDATVSQTGLVTGVSKGSAMITASSGGKSDTAFITVEKN